MLGSAFVDTQSNHPSNTFGASLPLASSTPDAPIQLRLGWRIFLTLVLLSLLALLGLWLSPDTLKAAPSSRPATQSSGDPLVLAFYYTWFDEQTWTYDRLSDLPAQPYASRDREVMGRHIQQAQGAGIDAFLVAWYGPHGDSNQTEPNLAAMLDEAAARGFRIGILFETDSPFLGNVGAVTDALQQALSRHASHPAYLRVDGRPVLFFWRPTLYSVDTWQAIRQQVDPGHTSIWIGEGVDTSYLAVFDGHHLYSNTWNPPADLYSVNQKFAGQVAAARERFGSYKFWVATVMPGYNDVRIRPGVGFVQDREGGNYFARSWQAAMASNPNWIVINSFNEWPEGTYIEPSAAFGDQYLALAGQWSGQFKAGGGVAVAAAQVPAPPPPTPTPLPTPAVPTAYVTVFLLNLRAGPGTDYPILDQLAQGTALPITGHHPTWPEWWQVEYGGQTGWVYAPMVQTAGPLEQVPLLPVEAVPQAPTPTATPEPATEALPSQPLAQTTSQTSFQLAFQMSPVHAADMAPVKPVLSH